MNLPSILSRKADRLIGLKSLRVGVKTLRDLSHGCGSLPSVSVKDIRETIFCNRSYL